MVKKKTKKKAVKKSKAVYSEFPWFKRRDGNIRSSWGIVPINWKGWTAIIILVLLNVFSANYFDFMNAEFDEISKTIVVFLLSIIVFVLIARKKTKGVEIW